MDIKVGSIIEYVGIKYYVADIDNNNIITAYSCKEDSKKKVRDRLISLFKCDNINYGMDYTKSYLIDIKREKDKISVIGTADDDFNNWFSQVNDCITKAKNEIKKKLLFIFSLTCIIILLGLVAAKIIGVINVSQASAVAFFGLFASLAGGVFGYDKISQAIVTSCIDYALKGENVSIVSRLLSLTVKKELEKIDVPIPKSTTLCETIGEETKVELGIADTTDTKNPSIVPIGYDGVRRKVTPDNEVSDFDTPTTHGTVHIEGGLPGRGPRIRRH